MKAPQFRIMMTCLALTVVAASVAGAHEPPAGPAPRDRIARFPEPAPFYFNHHHASTELEGFLIGYGFASHGYGLGSKYFAEGLYYRELAREKSAQNDYDEYRRKLEKWERYWDLANARKAHMKKVNEDLRSRRAPRMEVTYVTHQEGIKWPEKLLDQRFDARREAVERAYSAAVLGDADAIWDLRTQLRSLAEEVAGCVKGGLMHPNTHQTMVTFERLVNEQTLAIQKAAAKGQP